MHWLANAALRAGLPGSEVLSIPGTVSHAVAWDTASRVLGLPERQLAVHLAGSAGVRVAELDGCDPRALKLVPERIARRYQVFPLRDDGSVLVVATADPTDLATEQAVSFATGRNIRFELAGPRTIGEAVNAAYAPERSVDALLGTVEADILDAVRVVEDVSPEVVREKDVQAAPVVRLTNLVLREAVVSRASDVHIEPGPKGGTVRFRIDGVMHVHMQLPMGAINRVVSRIKVLSRLDIADRTRPQDGRTRINVEGKTLELRVSTVPTRESEKAVIRILRPDTIRTLDDANMGDRERALFRQLLGYREGIVLVTGPTGSGKTSTLYAALREVAEQHVNIITVEDPIEYELSGTTQVQVDAKRGITFGSALRAILRQDPDVIFVGEIRDLETAEIAAHAALTGHLVLATLHANDAMGAIARLVDIGLDRASVAASLRGCVAQRLIRRICPECAADVGTTLTAEESRLADLFGVAPKVRAVGCPSCCSTGYRGRMAVAEIGAMSLDLAERIVAGGSAASLQAAAIEAGMRSLREVALERVREGLSTLQEVARVIGEPATVSDSLRRVESARRVERSADRRGTGDRRGQPRRADDAATPAIDLTFALAQLNDAMSADSTRPPPPPA